ncbi:MAG: flagellar hook-associated protein FlgK [Pirellulales bacterium]
MSLFGAMQLGANALRAHQIGLQVTGQNISNVNTPGYIREEVVMSPSATQRLGHLLIGTGVQVDAVVQKIDKFLEDRLRGSTSDRASAETQEQFYTQLEQIVGELSDTDLSTSMNEFFGAIQGVLAQPESVDVRNLAILKGQSLAEDIVRMHGRVTQARVEANETIEKKADDVNRLAEEIRSLNVRIVQAEGGGVSESDAVGLRDRRSAALSQLSEIVNIRTAEQQSGAVNVFVGGEYLVFEGSRREVDVQLKSDEGLSLVTLEFADTGTALQVTSGNLAGLTTARDDILGGFIDDLDNLASTLAFEFNRLFSSGQGLSGFQSLTSTSGIADTSAALDSSTLDFAPVTGSFQIKMYDTQTNETTKTVDVFVKLDGESTDTSLDDIVSEINNSGVLEAKVDSTGRLTIRSLSPAQDFYFANDDSGFLAAMGLNTFFTGATAGNLAVNQTLLDDPGKFAASSEGIGAGTGTAVELAAFLDRPLETANDFTIKDVYDRMIGGLTQSSSESKAVAEGFAVFEETLRGQSLSVSGVNIDEEVIRMISFQRAYQATARYISTVSSMLETLINL